MLLFFFKLGSTHLQHMRNVHSIILKCEEKALLSFNYCIELALICSLNKYLHTFYTSVWVRQRKHR